MASDGSKRAWLRENVDPDMPARGRISSEHTALYEQARGEAVAAMKADDDGWDLPDGGMADLITADEEPAVPVEPERKPRTRSAARAQARANTSLTSRLLNAGKGKPQARKKAPPRMSLEKFTSRMYSNLGRMVAPLSRPMSNCLQAQAAFAGVVLEDMVRNTVADKVLQPLARAEDKLDKGFALFVPPLACLALEHSLTLPPQQQMVRQSVIMPILRESLRVGLEVSEGMADRLQARLEQDAKWDAEVDKMIALIFGRQEATAEDAETAHAMAGAAA
jgi:hypothetical protein